MLFDLPFWLWVIWGVSLCFAAMSKGARGAASTMLCFFAFLSIRYFTPQLGPWQQYGLYFLVVSLWMISAFVSKTIRWVHDG